MNDTDLRLSHIIVESSSEVIPADKHQLLLCESIFEALCHRAEVTSDVQSEKKHERGTCK